MHPPAWKQFILTFLGIYPLLLIFLPILFPLLEDWPMPLRTAVIAGLLVAMMTFVMIPLLRKILGNWLK